MANVLSLEDVVNLGIEKEAARRDFYGKVTESFDDPDLVDLFTKLRDWEEAHIRRFGSVKEKLGPLPPNESYEGEMDAYMQSIVDERFYQEVSPESFARNVTSPVQAIDYGITFEKDAILFFIEMMRYLQSDDKNIIMELMEEERSHIVYLIKLKKKFTDT